MKKKTEILSSNEIRLNTVDSEIKDLSKILLPIIRIQRNYFRNPWNLYLFSFGWEDEKLKKTIDIILLL